MTIQITCQCGKQLSAPDKYAGRKATCKACGAILSIPSTQSASVPAQPVEQAKLDEMLYDASPSMFRNHPIRFIFGLLFLALTGAIAFAVPKRPGEHTLAFVPPGAIALIFIIWWLKCRNTRLTITRRKVTLRRGILSKALNEVRLVDIRNIRIVQGLLQRVLGVGAVGISTSGQADIEIEVRGIPNPGRVREIIDRYRG
jgi:membrane protein YdbS with pleckstrin-like domain